MTEPATPPGPLDSTVSVFDGVGTTVAEQVSLRTMLQRIQGGTYRAQVERARQLYITGDLETYKRRKEALPSFTPGCSLTSRALKVPWAQKLRSVTTLVHLDVDHLADPEAVKAQFAREGSTVFAFTSPSGAGVKVGIAATGITDPASYKEVWRAVVTTWKQTHPQIEVNEDRHVSHLGALCFISYDPNLYLNAQAASFVIPPPTPKTTPKHRSASPPADPASEYTRVATALACVPNHDADYDTWLTLGMALHSTGEGWARDVWDGWSRQSQKYDDRKQASSWNSFSQDGDIHLGTLFHLAQQHGYAPPRKGPLRQRRRHAQGASPDVPDMTQPPGASVRNPEDAPPDAAPLVGHQDQEEAEEEPTPQQAAETLLARLGALEEDEEKHVTLERAIGQVATLPAEDWMGFVRRLKAVLPSVNLNHLESIHGATKRQRMAQAAQEVRGPSQAQLAENLAVLYAGRWAYDLSRQGWMVYAEGIWSPLETELVNQHIGDFMNARLQGGYTWYELSGVEHLLRTRLAQSLSLEPPGWLPFRNGALHLATMTLHAHTPERPFTWQLPHAYDPGARCLKTQDWLHEVTRGAHDQVQVLRAYAKAVLVRLVNLQRYLEMIGPGGTGKGTFTRLLTAMVGVENTFATELKHLETNRFETSNLRGKVLMLVTDAERYSGPVNQLKAITGQDFIRMEEKKKQQRTEIAPVMVVVAANEPIQSADYTSGLVRRRLSMAFRHVPASPRDLLSWHPDGWQGELAPELPGVLNWVLALPNAQMKALLQRTTSLVPSLQETWAQALVETNPLADWADQALLYDASTDEGGKPRATVKVGIAKKFERSNDYEHQDDWLYPHYRAWVDATGQKPLSHRRFTGLLDDLFQNQLRLSGVGHLLDNQGSRFYGIRLRAYSDADKPLFITSNSAPVMDGKDTVRVETRASDGCEGCEGYLRNLRIGPHPPFACNGSQGDSSTQKEGGWGVYREVEIENGIYPSHPSLARGNASFLSPASLPSITGVEGTDQTPRSSITGAGFTGSLPVVGDLVIPLAADGSQIPDNGTPYPYTVIAIETGPDGNAYALFRESPGGWPLEQCHKVAAHEEEREERAAILEYEAGVDRHEAETLAWTHSEEHTP